MTYALKFAVTASLAAALASCGGIGDGNTIEKLQIVVSPVPGFEQSVTLDADTATERVHMYSCFCSNLGVLATFTNGTVVDFRNRVKLTSDDPAIAEVVNLGETDNDACPQSQHLAGMLIPRGVGTAHITATFGPLKDTLTVEVADASVGTYSLHPQAPALNADTAVGVGVALQIDATLDDRERDVSSNVTTWSFDNADDTKATIDTAGIVRGISPTGASPMVARAAFATCPVTATQDVNVGDILGPLTLEREDPAFATDGLLAVNSNEDLKATASLDFDGDDVEDSTQRLGTLISLSTTDSCTLREFDDTVPTTACRETATTCADTVPLCSSSQTTCTSGMTACRLEQAPIRATALNRILAVEDQGTTTDITARFPRTLGTETTLAAAIDDTTTTITVAALSNYPTTFPWFATIDADGAREDVRVTAADGTTLTVVRGISGGGGAAQAHAQGDSFEQRAYTSDANAPLTIGAKEGTLTNVVIETPGTLAPLKNVQLEALGTYVDSAMASRQQRVSDLIVVVSGATEVVWSTSDATIASVGRNTGLVFSNSLCGGRVNIRARASNSTDDSTKTFDSATTADDDACTGTDPLCDQVELCVATPSPVPLGTTCETTTTCP